MTLKEIISQILITFSPVRNDIHNYKGVAQAPIKKMSDLKEITNLPIGQKI